MCGGRSASAAQEQFGKSEVQIDLHSGSTGTARNELKRPRQVMNSSSKPPVALASAPKRHQIELPSPSNLTCTTVTEAAADVDRNSASKAPPGVFDFPMPKPVTVFDIRQFYDVFFHSLADGRSLIKPIVMEGLQPFDEIMDDDMQHIWLPILHDQPLIPIVYKKRRSQFSRN